MFASPAGGIVKEIRRGLKRRLLDIVIEIKGEEDIHQWEPLNAVDASREQITQRLMEGGGFAYIRQRPFDLLANPHKTPRAIFVNAVSSAPFAVPYEMQLKGHEKAFKAGLEALTKLTDGKVHFVCSRFTDFKPFLEVSGVEKHTIEGPHPIGNSSVHIHHIDPIRSVDEVVWTANALDVATIGYLIDEGKYLTDRIVSVAGPGVIPERTGYFKARTGFPIEGLIANKIPQGSVRFISGSVLTGSAVDPEDFLHFYDTSLSVIPESMSREFLHFFRLGIDKFTASGTYFSGHVKPGSRLYDFTTNLHGEERAFVIATPYNHVMPLNINTMLLVKAVMSEDYDSAEQLGLLEIAPEDFALPTFVCPCKIEMVDIMKNGLRAYAQEVV